MASHSPNSKSPNKQTFLPSKLTLTINFGTKDNPKSRSRAKRPKSATLYSPPASPARRKAERRVFRTSSLNDALIRYDQSSLHSLRNNSPSIHHQKRHSYQHGTNHNLNHTADVWKSSSKVKKKISQAQHRQSQEVPDTSIPSYRLAEALYESQKASKTNKRPQSARTPSNSSNNLSHQKQLHKQRHSDTPKPANRLVETAMSPNSDYSSVKYNYTFLKQPVSRISPRFTREMRRYKEEYNFVKSRFEGNELLLGIPNTRAFQSPRSPRESRVHSARSRTETTHKSEARSVRSIPNSARSRSHASERYQPSQLNHEEDERKSSEEGGDMRADAGETGDDASQRSQSSSATCDQPITASTEVGGLPLNDSLENDAPPRTGEEHHIPRPKHEHHTTPQSSTHESSAQHEQNTPTSQGSLRMQNGANSVSTSTSFHMDAMPPPKYFTTKNRQPKKRPSTATTAKRRIVKRKKSVSRPASASSARRHSSLASQANQRSFSQTSKNRNSFGHKPTHRVPKVGAGDRVFSGFPPSRAIPNQFFNRHRMDIHRKRQLEQKQLNQLLSTETVPTSPHDREPPKRRSSSSSSNRRLSRDELTSNKTPHNSTNKAPAKTSPSPNENIPNDEKDRQQQDIIDYYNRMGKDQRMPRTTQRASHQGEGDEIPTMVRDQLKKDDSPKNQTSLSQRRAISPSPVSPVLFGGSPTSSGGTSFSNGSPTHGRSDSPQNSSSSGSNNRHSRKRSQSVADKNVMSEWEDLQISPSNRSKLVEQSPNLRKRPNTASSYNARRSSDFSNSPLSNSLTTTPSSLFEYRRRTSDIDLPIQIAKKEMSERQNRNNPPKSQEEGSRNDRPVRPQTAKRRQSVPSARITKRPNTATGKKHRKNRAIKIKTPPANSANVSVPEYERVDSPMTGGIRGSEEQD